MTGSGSGRYAQRACASSLYAADSEPLPDPREAAVEALLAADLSDADPWDVLDVIDRAGLTFCWRTP